MLRVITWVNAQRSGSGNTKRVSGVKPLLFKLDSKGEFTHNTCEKLSLLSSLTLIWRLFALSQARWASDAYKPNWKHVLFPSLTNLSSGLSWVFFFFSFNECPVRCQDKQSYNIWLQQPVSTNLLSLLSVFPAVSSHLSISLHFHVSHLHTHHISLRQSSL